jgi:hypothetical protein
LIVSDDPQTQNATTVRIAIALVLAIAIAAGGWWYYRSKSAASAAAAVTAPAASVAGGMTSTNPDVRPPAVQHPLVLPEATSASTPPADPEGEDRALTGALTEFFGESVVRDWLVPGQVARHIVATVDNLPRNAHLEALRPVHAPTGAFAVTREVTDAVAGTERITLNAANFARYDAAVAIVSHANMQQLTAVYRRIYPLLQKSYEDLGYPDHYFNDRVVATIDHLLQTPEPAGPITLVQPKVLYQYADQDLESRSTGQKLLLRMGVDHARTIKQKLRELRTQIATGE